MVNKTGYSQVPICLFIRRVLHRTALLADVPEGSEGYIVRLRVTNEQSLEQIERLVCEMARTPSAPRCADLHPNTGLDRTESGR